MSCAPKGKKEGRMLAGLHLKHVASRPRTLSAPPKVSGECRRDYIIPCGFNSRLSVDVGREKFGWDESRQGLSTLRLLGGPNAGRDYISCHDKTSRSFPCRPCKGFGWRMPAGVHGKAGFDSRSCPRHYPGTFAAHAQNGQETLAASL